MEQEEMLAFVRWVAEQTGTDEETVANQLQELSQSEEGQQQIQEMYNAYIQSTGGVQQGQLQTQANQAPVMARMGAKISHIKRIYGMCPEGYELKSFKVGGKVCKKCQKVAKKAEGGDVKKEENSKAKESFKKKTPNNKVTKAQKSVPGGVKPRTYDKNSNPVYDPNKAKLTSDTLNAGDLQQIVFTYSNYPELYGLDKFTAPSSLRKEQEERDTMYLTPNEKTGKKEFIVKNASTGTLQSNAESPYTVNQLKTEPKKAWESLTKAFNEAYQKITGK